MPPSPRILIVMDRVLTVAASGGSVTDWQERLGVPRAHFIPSVIWVDAADGFRSVSRDDDEARWQELVAADEPIVTQVDDGATAPGGTGLRPSSSSSQPSLVATMLDALDPQAGQRILEIGTGTGWNAALLSARVRERGHLVSVEVDADVADHTLRALAGYSPLVVTGDGTKGYPPDAPYDGVICTASVRAVPPAWIEQTRPGGRIVTPWGSDYGDDALTSLTVYDDGSASGRCGISLAFMRVRDQRRDFLEPTTSDLATADATRTVRTARELFEMVDFGHAAFTIGLRVPRCYLTVDDVDDDHRRIELHDVSSRSWARVTMVRGHDPWAVHQLGPRRLWREVDTAYQWWCDAGRPTPDRYGLTVAPNGTHRVWIDAPDREDGWLL